MIILACWVINRNISSDYLADLRPADAKSVAVWMEIAEAEIDRRMRRLVRVGVFEQRPSGFVVGNKKIVRKLLTFLCLLKI